MASPSSYLGTQLDRRYRLERSIGEGASSWVFAARDQRLDRAVAVKVWKASVSAFGASHRRFIDEGRLLAKLAHPHVVAVHDSDETPDGLAYLVMELVDGCTLEAELVRLGRLPPEEIVSLMLPLLGAVACAHDLGMIHRDIKPANIVLAHYHGERRAKLLDFGIAKVSDAHSAGLALGTPSYMAPEQARGEPLTAAIDVWAMGVVFFRALSGRLPFDASNTTSLLLKITQQQAPRFASVCPGLSPRLALALDRALAHDPCNRYQTMRDFARALAEACALDGVSVAKQPDAIGLPDFEAWLRGVNMEDTRRLSEREVVRVGAVTIGPRGLAGARSWRRTLNVGVVAALLCVFAIEDPASLREGPRETATANDLPVRAVLSPPAPPAAALPPPAFVSAPAQGLQALRQKARPRATARHPPASPDAARATPDVKEERRSAAARDQPPGGVVMTWEW